VEQVNSQFTKIKGIGYQPIGGVSINSTECPSKP
jgi:hypothetical protein